MNFMQRAKYLFTGKGQPPTTRIINHKISTATRDGGFNAGVVDRLSTGFTGAGLSVNEMLRKDLVKMRHRSRELVNDNDYGKKFVSMVKTNVVGNKGIRLQAKAKGNNGQPDKMDNDAIETAWKDWSHMKNCSVNSKLSLLDIQRIAVTTVAMEGECLIRIVYRAVYKYGMALQLIEADRLDVELNETLKDGNRIVMSVEMDEFDVPVAYYVLTSHPSETLYTFRGRKYMRIPADEMIHLFLPERISQARGIPWMHASIRRLNMVGGYEEAELVAARAGASKMGFYYTETGDSYTGDDADTETGAPIQNAEPGTFEQLPMGTKFESYDPQHPTGAYNYFLKGTLKGAAAGLNVSYTGYTGDLEAVNYSSIRAGLIEERENWRVVQGWFVEHCMATIYERWLSGALTRGLIVNQAGVKLPLSRKEKFLSVTWQARGWAWVDPLKDQQANDAAVAAGHKTNSAVAAATGEDLEEIYEQLAWEKELAAKYGLDFSPNTGMSNDKENDTEDKPDENKDDKAQG
jgi:lambda family phage portal protein